MIGAEWAYDNDCALILVNIQLNKNLEINFSRCKDIWGTIAVNEYLLSSDT